MSSLLEGLTQIDKANLTPELRQVISGNIGDLASMARAVTEAIPGNGLPQYHNDNLAYTASLLADLIEQLNSLIAHDAREVAE